jgi:hypothetical protein
VLGSNQRPLCGRSSDSVTGNSARERGAHTSGASAPGLCRHLVTPSRIVAALAVLICLATLARATRCTAGGELLIGITLTGVLAAVWNDNREGGLAARIVKFIIVLVLAGGFVGFFAVALHVRCVAVVSPTRSLDMRAHMYALIQGVNWGAQTAPKARTATWHLPRSRRGNGSPRLAATLVWAVLGSNQRPPACKGASGQ